MNNQENPHTGQSHPFTREEAERLVQSGEMVRIEFGTDPMAYFFLNEEDPQGGIDTYQKIKGRLGFARLRIEKRGETPEDLQILQDAESAFNQLRSVMPNIDEINAEYERQLDELKKGWSNL